MLTFSLEMLLYYENVNIVSIFIHYRLKRKCQRVPNRFFGIQDFPYWKLRIHDFEAKSGKIPDLKYVHEGLQDCTKFWVEITGLKNPIKDPQYLLWIDGM